MSTPPPPPQRHSGPQQQQRQAFQLKCGNHNAAVCLAYYKFFKAQKYTDVTVCCQYRQYDCHRLVLAVNSDYFASVFERADCAKPVVVLHEVPDKVFEVLVEYMYTGQSQVDAADMQEVLRQAGSLRIKGLEVGDKELQQLTGLSLSDEKRISPAKRRKGAHQSGGSLETVASSASSSGAATSGSGGSSDNSRSAAALLQAAEDILGGGAAGGKGKAETSTGHKSRKGQPKRLARVHSPEPGNLVIADQGPQHPVDFSQANATSAAATGARPKGSILDNMLHERTRSTGGDSAAAAAAAALTNGVSSAPTSTAQQITQAAAAAAAATANLPSIESYLQLLQAQQKQVAAAASAASASSDNKESSAQAPVYEQFGLDINERLRTHFLSTLPAQATGWMQMNQTAAAAAAAAAAATANGHDGGATRTEGGEEEEDVEEEEELIDEEEEGEGSSAMEGEGGSTGDGFTPPPPVAGRRPSGRPASASIARDEFGNPKLGPNGKPMVACEICGKELADPSSLYRHRKIHSGEKPHGCPFCKRRFIQRYNMRQHLKTHKFKGVTQDMIDRLEPDLRDVFVNNRF